MCIFNVYKPCTQCSHHNNLTQPPLLPPRLALAAPSLSLSLVPQVQQLSGHWIRSTHNTDPRLGHISLALSIVELDVYGAVVVQIRYSRGVPHACTFVVDFKLCGCVSGRGWGQSRVQQKRIGQTKRRTKKKDGPSLPLALPPSLSFFLSTQPTLVPSTGR